MPIFPTYNSQQNIATNPSAPVRDEASQPFKDQQKIIGVMADIAQKMSDQNDVMQATEAKAKSGLALADIQSRAAADPDFKNSDKYYKELDNIRTNSVSLISNQQVASTVGAELDYDVEVAKLKIGQNFRNKELVYNEEMVKTKLDLLLKNKLDAYPGSQEAFVYDQKIEALLNDNVRAGVLTIEKANKILQDAQRTSVKYEIYNDVATEENNSIVLKQLRDRNDPKYSHLDPKTRLDLIEESQRRIFQNNQTFKRNNEIEKDGRFQNIFQKANEGTLTLNDLDIEAAEAEAGNPGALKQKEILDIRKGIQNRIKNDLELIVENDEDAANYQKFIDNFISNETDRQKGREAIVNAFKDGYLSPKEANFLNKLKRETEQVQQLRSREDFLANTPMVPFKNAINAVNDFFTGKKNFTEAEKALAIKRLLNASADGNDPQEYSQALLTEMIIKKNPGILNLSPEGQIVVDANGNIRIMNNKGEYREISSTGKVTSGKKETK